MKSHKVMRRTIFTAALIVVVNNLAPVSAIAEPADSAAVQKYKDLNNQAAQLNDAFLKAQEDRAARQADIDKAAADLATAKTAQADAKAKEGEFRDQVDSLSAAAFNGARYDKLSALLTGTSPDDFLARATALDVLSADNNNALKQFKAAVDKATDASNLATDAGRRATEARDAAQKLADDIAAKKKDLDAQIKQLKSQYSNLSPADQAALKGPKDDGVYLNVGTGAAGKAVQFALSRRGDTYDLGGSKPPVFDCSGLTMWAYGQAGVTIPRTSRQQYTVGKAVSKADLQPGDLLFYGGSAATIHHVAMYIGDGMIVHASDYGIPVKSAPLSNGGKDFFGARRIVG
ncbi:NlpC/P60 family protein [Kibdelosporangium lantanae]|uniref:NlpC/P60 family protein n=1 Tax=Kibdelosporangium lantanae TaxID=1497396 RepID=A0ABW3M1U1_9PSEU